MNVTEYILKQLELHYNYSFKFDFDTENIVSLHKFLPNGGEVLGEISITFETTSSDKICGIDISGPGFVYIDQFGEEWKAKFDNEPIYKQLEDTLYHDLARDYAANYNN